MSSVSTSPLCPTHASINSDPKDLARLCTYTDITASDRGSKDVGIPHKMTRRTLADGAAAGCRLCKAILPSLRWGSSMVRMELEPNHAKYLEDVLDGVGEDEMDMELDFRMAYLAQNGGEWWDVSRVIGWKEDEYGFPPQIVIEMEVAAEDGDPAAQYISARRVDPVVSSDKSFRTAMAWIDECIHTHADCSPVGDATLPTRVLDIAPLESGRDPCVYITQKEAARYIALSYCWGGPQPVTSTLATLDDNIRGIPMASLPQTIKDAIYVTRKMNCRYLWIDALCILQDSDEDKSREIGQMARIYQDSYCTISAANAKSVGEGFLQDRPHLGVKGDWFTMPYCCPGGDGKLGVMHVRSEATYDPMNEPINQRGWTLQEHLLPPRLLIYDSYRLRWECQSRQYSNGGASNLLRRVDFGRISQSLRRGLSMNPGDELSPDHQESLHKCWASSLENYARRQLTVGGDKLPAISAIASDYASLTGDNYLAGLWQRHLGSSLLWNVQVYDGFSHKKSSRPAGHPSRAPSWSWASVDNRQIFVERQPFAGDVELVRHSVTPLSSLAPFGAVASGASITLRGMCRDVVVKLGYRGGYVDLWDLADDGARRDSKLGQCVPDSPDEFQQDRNKNKQEEVVLRCLAVTPAPIGGRPKWVRGLVVRYLPGMKAFSRVGTFSVNNEDSLRMWLEGSKSELVEMI
ncbi:heterokaryon incompatibility protein-domain-containing protein [Cladorrhinum sp. PSN332]|nr:heterokaryon incompatibility protein-domain-containing protein [Cladorrhinum sp. PSN332]